MPAPIAVAFSLPVMGRACVSLSAAYAVDSARASEIAVAQRVNWFAFIRLLLCVESEAHRVDGLDRSVPMPAKAVSRRGGENVVGKYYLPV